MHLQYCLLIGYLLASSLHKYRAVCSLSISPCGIPYNPWEGIMSKYPLFCWHTYFCHSSSVAVFLAFCIAAPVSAQSTLLVDGDGNGTATNCNASVPAFNSIQAAINAAAAGDTIFVCPGIYDEQIIVTTNDLTIRGAGTGLTVVQPSHVTKNTVRPGTTFPVMPIVLIDGASGVTIANLTIDGSLADSGANLFPTCGGFPFYTGIYYRISSGIIDAAHVTNIKSATACTFAILVQTDQSGVGSAANVFLKNNLVDQYGLGGINCIGQQTACTLTGNTIRGNGPVSDTLQAGIIVRAEAQGSISGNIIIDHFFLGARGAPESAAGIFLFFANPDSNPHVRQDNIFVNNQLDVQRLGTAAAFD